MIKPQKSPYVYIIKFVIKQKSYFPFIENNPFCYFKYYFISIAFLTIFTISSAVKPYAFISSSGFPLSPKVSFTPTLKTGTGAFPLTTSHTAEPNPPIMLCSSAVTIAPVSLAALIMASSSIGFIV